VISQTIRAGVARLTLEDSTTTSRTYPEREEKIVRKRSKPNKKIQMSSFPQGILVEALCYPSEHDNATLGGARQWQVPPSLLPSSEPKSLEEIEYYSVNFRLRLLKTRANRIVSDATRSTETQM